MFIDILLEVTRPFIVKYFIPTKEDLDEHLEKKLLPYVTNLYAKTKKVGILTLDKFLDDIVEAVEKGNLESEVC